MLLQDSECTTLFHTSEILAIGFCTSELLATLSPTLFHCPSSPLSFVYTPKHLHLQWVGGDGEGWGFKLLWFREKPEDLLLSTDSLCLQILWFPFFFNKLHFCLHWAFIAAHGLPLVAVSGSYSLLRWAPYCDGFSYFRVLAPGARASVVAAHGLSSCGLCAPECGLSRCSTRA